MLHPEDEKNPIGITGQTVYWSVESLTECISQFKAKGATIYRGPLKTSLGEYACILVDPFGNRIGILGAEK